MSKIDTKNVLVHSLAVFFISSLFYGCTVLYGVSPGVSASAIVRAAQLEPVTSYAHPLYYYLTSWVADNSGNRFPFFLNLFSSFFGALLIACLFFLIAHIPHNRSSEETRLFQARPRDSLISGWIGSLAAMFCVPMQWASTRAMENTFDLAGLALILCLMVVYRKRGGKRLSMGIVTLLGLGCNELPTALMLLPVLLPILGYMLWIHAEFTVRRLIVLLVCFLFGFSFCFLNAYLFMQTEMYQWAGFSNFSELIRVLWRDQVHALTRSVPRLGWMIVAFLTLLPFVLTIAPKNADQGRALGSSAGSFLLHLLLLGISVFVLVEGKLSPWSLMGERPLLITPYLLSAVTFGYLSVYFMIISQKVRSGERPWHPIPFFWGLIVAGVMSGVLLWRSHGELRAASIEKVNWIAERVVEGLPDNSHLVSSSYMNPLVLIKAAQHGGNIELLNPVAARSKVYLRYLSSRYESHRYQGLAKMGIFPLIQEMLRDTETDLASMLTLDLPELLQGYDLIAVPHPLFYSASTSLDEIDLQELNAEHEAFFSSFKERFGEVQEGVKGEGRSFDRALLEFLSRNQNNFAVLCMKRAERGLAHAALDRALQFNPENVSTMLNRVALARSGSSEELQVAEAEVKQYLDTNPNKQQFWALARRHGEIYDPEVFARQGMTWALSGNPERGLESLKRAQASLGVRPDIVFGLAGAYAASGDYAASRTQFLQLLELAPDNPDILRNLSRLEIRAGNLDEAATYLNKLKSIRGQRVYSEVQLAVLDALKGDVKSAQEKLKEITRLNSDQLDAWLALAVVSQGLDGQDEWIEQALIRVQSRIIQDVQTASLLANFLQVRGDIPGAIEAQRQVVRLQPQNLRQLEFLIEIYLTSRQLDEARDVIAALLSLDSRNITANRAMGVLQLREGSYAEAEESLRVSYQQGHLQAGIDLAWLLQRRDALDQAEEIIRDILRSSPEDTTAWHTLGLIQFRSGELEGARDSLFESLKRNVDNLIAQIYLARVYAEQGERKSAEELMGKMKPYLSQLPPVLQEMVEETRARL